ADAGRARLGDVGPREARAGGRQAASAQRLELGHQGLPHARLRQLEALKVDSRLLEVEPLEPRRQRNTRAQFDPVESRAPSRPTHLVQGGAELGGELHDRVPVPQLAHRLHRVDGPPLGLLRQAEGPGECGMHIAAPAEGPLDHLGHQPGLGPGDPVQAQAAPNKTRGTAVSG
ncbi:MAG: hypothetical protein ACK55I_36665, partial [bacterium]